MSIQKQEGRAKRKKRIRKKVNGTAERPRLSIFRSAKHMYAQIVDDGAHRTLAAASTLDGELETVFQGEKHKKVDKAKKVGILIAKRALAAGIDKVVFDRNGFIYHGRVAAIAAGAREGGLKF
jgi:large subunit ribosomal protein L18